MPHHKIDTPMSGKGSLFQMATVTNGPFKDKIVYIFCEFSCGNCLVDLGESQHGEEGIKVVHIKDLRLWYNVERVDPINKTVDYRIWMEGYRLTGSYASATCLGLHRARSFEEACDLAAKRNNLEDSYNKITNTIFGCKLFDNEIDARRSFG